jgi:hypothetical protein
MSDLTVPIQPQLPLEETSNYDSNDEIENLPVTFGQGWKPIDSLDLSSTAKARAITALLLNYGQTKLGFKPYDWQLNSAAAVSLGYDMLCIARTGDGKSGIFQLLSAHPRTCHLVISPLIGLIEEQVQFMNSMGVTAAACTSEGIRQHSQLWKEIDQGKYRMLFASPETVLTPDSYFWHKIIANKQHKFVKGLLNGGAIIVDEAHVIWKWGESGFRTEYRNIGNLRTYLHNVPFLLLSATITGNVRQYLRTVLHLAQPSYILQRSIARRNIQLIVARAQQHGYSDLNFLINSYSSASMIPKTMVFVDSRNEAHNVARYLRKNLPHGDTDTTMTVSVYTAGDSPNTRREHMEWFLKGDCRILICTDAAGMGMNIPNVQVVVQLRLTEKLCLSDVWQRLGRCARDSSIVGLAVILVDDKYILPYRFGPDDSFLQAFTQPVTWDNRQSIRNFTSKLYTASGSGSGPYRKLDPALLWVVNTYGCRTKALLATFDDPETYKELGCICDNCSFPERQSYDRQLPPEELSIPSGMKFARGERVRYRNRLQEQHAALLETRKTTVQAHRDLGIFSTYGFKLNQSLRYDDTSAYSQDLIDAQLAENLALQKKVQPAESLVEDVTVGLLSLASFIYENDLKETGVSQSCVFPWDQVQKVAQECLTIENEKTLEACVGPQFSLSNSFVGPYILRILEIIDKAKQNHQEKQLTEKTAEPAKSINPGRKRKHQIVFQPEESFDLSDPKQVTLLERQRKAQAYEKELEQRAETRKMNAQISQAKNQVEKKTERAAKRKQKAASGTASKASKEKKL